MNSPRDVALLRLLTERWRYHHRFGLFGYMGSHQTYVLSYSNRGLPMDLVVQILRHLHHLHHHPQMWWKQFTKLNKVSIPTSRGFYCYLLAHTQTNQDLKKMLKPDSEIPVDSGRVHNSLVLLSDQFSFQMWILLTPLCFICKILHMFSYMFLDY